MDELRSSGNVSREDFMKIRQTLNEQRDLKLKAIFTPEQMTKWKDEVVPSLNPQKPKPGPNDKQ